MISIRLPPQIPTATEYPYVTLLISMMILSSRRPNSVVSNPRIKQYQQ